MCTRAMGVLMKASRGGSLSYSFKTRPVTEPELGWHPSGPPLSTLHKSGVKEGAAYPTFYMGAAI